MIDFIKIIFNEKNDLEKIFKKQNLVKVRRNISKNDKGSNLTIDYPMKNYCHNLCLKVNKDSGELYGSFHKLYNNLRGIGNMNHNDFDLYDLEAAIIVLEKYLGVDDLPEHKITNLEVGFNIDLDETPFNYIQESVLFYNLKKDSVDSRHKKNETIKKFSFNEYEIKIYDKSAQYGLNKNIIRVEVKYTSSKLLRILGINVINDLLCSNTLSVIILDYFKKICCLTIIDSWNGSTNSAIVSKDMMKLEKYTNPFYWNELRAKNEHMKLKRGREEFDRLIGNNKLYNRHKYIIDNIYKKYMTMYQDYFYGSVKGIMLENLHI
ncbi:hypothetical protein CMU02_02630 [Elizabethkingia anophelis]|uniref:hypothetical protein n=1 Tax=Elizabethkingia anophelis TaxID=1117645 RepID=UPI00293CEBFC|nr:hypothetical protein [Elizabethkingia anophelis]